MIQTKYVIVGAGFYGAVFAERIATVLGQRVTLIDRRSHLGGNSASAIDPATGIECHTYGSHIFHTSNERVWKYLQAFTAFTSYQHKVYIQYDGRVYTMPINLKTVNDYFGLNLRPHEVFDFLAKEIAAEGIGEPQNLEEKAISLIGRKLYEAFIRGYTLKQWNKDPKELPASIITRLPVRTCYNNNYFNDPHQGVPLDGYLKIFDRMLRHPNIEIALNTPLQSLLRDIPKGCTVIYTGMLDELFDYQLGMLEWRSLRFEWETRGVADYQGTTVMNYGDLEIPFTRIHEFKHYHPERQEVFNSHQTIICKEFSRDYTKHQEAYYPVNTPQNMKLYQDYVNLFRTHYPRWRVGGRLGAYQYWDMDKAIDQALIDFDNMTKEEKL